MKKIVLLLVSLLISTSAFAYTSEKDALYTVGVNSYLKVTSTLKLSACHALVYIQNGAIVKSDAIDKDEPHCWLMFVDGRKKNRVLNQGRSWRINRISSYKGLVDDGSYGYTAQYTELFPAYGPILSLTCTQGSRNEDDITIEQFRNVVKGLLDVRPALL